MELADMPRHRPMAFDKMESLIKEMQDPETGVPVRSQKLFLTYIPSAFMGYDLVEWLMERFNLDETSNGNVEAINLANQLCQHGYFFPVNDSKNLVLKDDSSLYRFQSPYYWPWQPPRVAGSGLLSGPTLGPDNVEYAIYLVKRTLRNKQRHGLDDYEVEALSNLKKNLAAKLDFITMQAEEQVRLAKDRKKGDKIVSDSQERAYWRVARPPPGMPNALEACPVPVRVRNPKPKKRTIHQVTREIEYLKASLDRTRVKTSIALEALVAYSETFTPYDTWITPPQPSNPWVSDDTLYWQINGPLVDVPSEKRVQRWALSIEELVSDPTGLQEFTSFLRKEYSHENIRFWLAVMDLRRSTIKQIPKKLEEIYEEFLKSGAPCEINIDGATAERVAEGIRSGSRYALDHAANHVYNLLLKKDCYPRFIRSDHFQRLLTEGKNVHQKKAKFFNFGGQVKKKPGPSAGGTGLSRRRGSDRSLSGSAHELAVCAAQPPRPSDPPPHSHSQSNLADIITFRDPLENDTSEVLPWECGPGPTSSRRRQDSAADSGSSSSDVSAVPERARRLPQQSTLDGGLRGAPPPLRRLSAVEPRHLAPLVSPPPPRPPPAPTVTHPPHPTPTISVSSVPDDESTTGSPEESRSLAHSEEPASVFASADVTPTETPRITLLSSLSDSDKSAPSSVLSDSLRTDNFKKDVKVVQTCGLRSENSTDESVVLTTTLKSNDSESKKTLESSNDAVVKKTISREPSTIIDISPASSSEMKSTKDESANVGKDNDKILEIIGKTEPACILPAEDMTEISSVEAIKVESSGNEKIADTSALLQTQSLPVVASSASPIASEVVAISCAVEDVPSVLAPTVAQATVAPPIVIVSSSVSKPLSAAPVAPLAVCEDIGVDDDNVEKVPLAPLQRIPVDSKAASESVTTENIAHRDELSTISELNVVKLDESKVKQHSGDKQRNDICPWEDESSCDSDAPFVKTYATLGYL